MTASPNIAHDIMFAAIAFVPVWMPVIALLIFWRKIDKKLFYLVTGILASGGIQHIFSFMHLFAISNGAALFEKTTGWTELAVQTMILAIPGAVLSATYLYWVMRLLAKIRPNLPFNLDEQARQST